MKTLRYYLIFTSFLFIHHSLIAKPLVLISGGFASCDVSFAKDNISWGSAVNSSFLKEFKAQIKKLEEEDTPYIYTCLFINGSIIDEKKTKLKITSSLYPNQERSIDMSKYKDYVEQVYKDYEAEWELDKIIMIGHSHGSWLMMKTLLDLNSNFFVEKLVTLDAISREHCGLWDYVGALFSFGIGDECQRFPKDFDFDQKEQILGRVDSWTNMYQKEFIFLHSGPVNHPGVLDLLIPKVTHMSINNSQFVWDTILKDSL
jgi:pimeloyl-ACP methyl ester carboxylesterase